MLSQQVARSFLIHPTIMNTSQSCGLTTPTKGTARVIDCKTNEAQRGSHTVVLGTNHNHILHTFPFRQLLLFKLPHAASKPLFFCRPNSGKFIG
jgi:hypothetical protein